MAIIRGYMGVSLDGYIAAKDSSIDWLRAYDGVDLGRHGYDHFIAGIGTVVMGRDTYDAIPGLDIGWPYEGKRALIVTSRPLADPIGSVETRAGDIPALVAELRRIDDGDVWIVGGGRLQQAMIAEGALDRLELFVVPEIVGDGIRVFPPNGLRRTVRLAEAEALQAGMVWLDYRFDPLTPPGAGSP